MVYRVLYVMIDSYASLLGARVAYKWTTECTHVIVDPFTPVTEEIIDIILANKPLVLSTWLEVFLHQIILFLFASFGLSLPSFSSKK